ncbi:MAG: PQQ-binding-like beta-propeller repeat protein [Draconibacterium sp.]
MKNFAYFLPFVMMILFGFQSEKEKSDWQGPNRDCIYPATNLLKQWPENGPEMAWSFEGLGFGHSTVAVANNRVFVTGVKDTIESIGSLYTFDLNGKLLWKKEYGKDFALNFHGTRSTPVVVDNLIYIESGMGAVYCLNTENGNEVWKVNFMKDLGVDSVIQFGYSESVLIDGDNLICVPGGKENNIVALNRFTGKTVWSSSGNEEIATYNSPILVNHNGKKLVIAMTSHSVMGFDAATGEKYWRVEQTQGNKIHANTPVYADGRLLVATAGREKTSGIVLLQLSEDGKSVSEIWRNNKLMNLMGGMVKLGEHLYLSAYLKSDWQVLDWNTGELKIQNKEFGGGSVIYADGLFYCYGENDGEIALMEASPEKIKVISKFKVPLGTDQHWARLVIDSGLLFVRHGNALMAYKIGE